MARTNRTKTHLENIVVVPKTAHGDASADIALQVLAVDQDVMGSPTSSFSVSNTGDVLAAGTLGVTGAATIGGTLGVTGVITQGGTEGNMVLNTRHRVTAAEIKAGHTLVTVPAALKFRLVSCRAIAYGGAVGATTTVDLLDGSTKLVAFAQASLTQSTVLTDGGTGAAVLADGASYVTRAAGADITVGLTGSDITTATGVDFILSYVLEA
jgi:hypothetical protein